MQTYHGLLQEEFEKRKQLNGAYSLRAYARDLGVSATSLSLILNYKQGLSVEAAGRIAQKLRLSEKKRTWFCESAGALHARNPREREAFKEKVKQYRSEAKVFSELQLEYFKVISDWWHFAILELTYLEGFQNSYEWMSRMLDVPADEVKAAVERMKSLELIREEDGKLKDVFQFLATPNDVPSLSLKKFHTQLMKKAMEALYDQDVLNREIASNIISIRKDRLPEFKEKLRNFRREIEADAGALRGKDAVYCLSMQFYELTKGNE